MLSLLAEKLIIAFSTFLMTICMGLIPFKLVKRDNAGNWSMYISMLSCFSGGVFLAACLLDLFPDVNESIDNIISEIEVQYGYEVEYPIAHFIITWGFFLVLIIEQAVLFYKEEHEISSVPDETTSLLEKDSEGHVTPSMAEYSSLRSILLLLALSFHSLFEGLAIGLQNQTGQLLSIFSAVIIHKGIMAFALGLNLAQSGLRASTFVGSNLIFSFASPIGVLIGLGVMDLKRSLGRDIANGVLQGISGGTFLYITFFEVLPHELRQGPYRLFKVLSVIVGFSCICGLLFITH